MDFDEIQTHIVNQQLTDRLQSENNNYRWKFKPAVDDAVQEFGERFVSKGSEVYERFMQEPCGVFMFNQMLRSKHDGARLVHILNFYIDIARLYSAERNDRIRISHFISEQYFKECKGHDNDTGRPSAELILNRDEMKMVIEALDDVNMPLDEIRPIIKRVENDIWTVHYQHFLQSEYFSKFLQLLEYSHRRVSAKDFAKIRILEKVHLELFML